MYAFHVPAENSKVCARCFLVHIMVGLRFCCCSCPTLCNPSMAVHHASPSFTVSWNLCKLIEYSPLLVTTQLWFLYPSQVLKSADIQVRDIKGCNTVGPVYPWLPEDLQTTVEVDWIMDVKSIDTKGQLCTETVWLWNIKNTGPMRLQNTASNSHLIFRYFPRKWPCHERPLYLFGERENTA